MSLRLALKIMKMSKPALMKMFGSASKGLAKRVEAGVKVRKSFKGKPLSSAQMKKPSKYEEYRDHFDSRGRRLD